VGRLLDLLLRRRLVTATGLRLRGSHRSTHPVYYLDPEFNQTPHIPKASSMAELVRVWLTAIDTGMWHIDPATSRFAPLDPMRPTDDEDRNSNGLL
jgi:hypothetical protein